MDSLRQGPKQGLESKNHGSLRGWPGALSLTGRLREIQGKVPQTGGGWRGIFLYEGDAKRRKPRV